MKDASVPGERNFVSKTCAYADLEVKIMVFLLNNHIIWNLLTGLEYFENFGLFRVYIYIGSGKILIQYQYQFWVKFMNLSCAETWIKEFSKQTSKYFNPYRFHFWYDFICTPYTEMLFGNKNQVPVVNARRCFSFLYLDVTYYNEKNIMSFYPDIWHKKGFSVLLTKICLDPVSWNMGRQLQSMTIHGEI